MLTLPRHVPVHVEVPRGGFVKRGSRGIDLVSPVPSPYNYGSIEGYVAEDGDPPDAIVLAPRLPRGHHGTYVVRAVVRFDDAGRADDKYVVGRVPTDADRRRVLAFFRLYGAVKRIANLARGRLGATGVRGWEDLV